MTPLHHGRPAVLQVVAVLCWSRKCVNMDGELKLNCILAFSRVFFLRMHVSNLRKAHECSLLQVEADAKAATSRNRQTDEQTHSHKTTSPCACPPRARAIVKSLITTQTQSCFISCITICTSHYSAPACVCVCGCSLCYVGTHSLNVKTESE